VKPESPKHFAEQFDLFPAEHVRRHKAVIISGDDEDPAQTLVVDGTSDADDEVGFDPFHGDPPNRRSDKETARILRLLDSLKHSKRKGKPLSETKTIFSGMA